MRLLKRWPKSWTSTWTIRSCTRRPAKSRPRSAGTRCARTSRRRTKTKHSRGESVLDGYGCPRAANPGKPGHRQRALVFGGPSPHPRHSYPTLLLLLLMRMAAYGACCCNMHRIAFGGHLTIIAN
uniref:Uncharacterized protein n=1 Tax=Anopheles atroparvus TaxID=41427 RepID=A0AAG5DJG6_ANOAO